MQIGFYFDQTRCTGCGTCIVACKDWNDIPAGPASWIHVVTIEKGERDSLFVASLVHTCYHCGNPGCLSACPAGAIVKRVDDGIVTVDNKLCLGNETCGFCREACPYGAPQFAPSTEAKMQKCNFCVERWVEGKKPICVMACPTRALDAGPLEEMWRKYGNNTEAEGFDYSSKSEPSIVFKKKKNIFVHSNENARFSSIPLAQTDK
jgi:anaerobic dimethyl sulfoxide reductase subunit B (iron-sulfur subunit)